MFRNALLAALCGLHRDWLYAVINIGGLAIGLAVAILIGLFIRDELSYDRFLPDHDRLYRMNMLIEPPGQKPISLAVAPASIAQSLTLDFPEIETVARTNHEIIGIRRGDSDVSDVALAADPDFFALFNLPFLAGDPATALSTPDSLVVTEAAALKYFGRRDPLGATIQMAEGHVMRVTGVLRDLPSDTHLELGLVVSALADFTGFGKEVAKGGPTDFTLYFRLRPGSDPVAVQVRLDDFLKRRAAPIDQTELLKMRLLMQPVAAIHLHPMDLAEPRLGGDLAALWALGTVALLILFAASVNFINIQTAGSSRRAVEIGVRKLSGASRRQLFAQFMIETLAAAALSLVIAIGLAELALPWLDGFLGRTIAFAYWREPESVLSLILLMLAVGLGAGFYPALVLSSYRPAVAFKAGRLLPGGGRLRQALVVVQFAVSIGLLIATAIIHGQTDFAMKRSLLDRQKPIMLISNLRQPFPTASFATLRDRLAGLPGVRAVSASTTVPTDRSVSQTTAYRIGQSADTPLSVETAGVDGRFFGVYGLKPVAGRLFAPDRKEPGDPIVLTEAAVRFLGFPSDAAAIDQEVEMGFAGNNPNPQPPAPSRVIGVVPDMMLKTVRDALGPLVFTEAGDQTEFLSIELDGTNLPDTIAAIDRVWHELAPTRPIRRFFLDARVAALYLDLTRQSQLFTAFAAVAVLIGGLGLYGLAGFTAERRTKEIGIRKALGASTLHVVLLLIWQFLRPVLIANALAWPIAWFAMRRWLDGFPLRIELTPAPFVAAGAAALIVALLTTGARVFAVARARPVLALRYE